MKQRKKSIMSTSNQTYKELSIPYFKESLGRNSGLYLQKSEAISTRILKVLENNLVDVFQSAIAREWARKLDKDIEYAFALLNAFQRGITDEI